MEKFTFISHNNTDPYFNIASEEYLLKHTDGYYVYLWVNSPAVIVGVNQNTFSEVRLNVAESKNIKIVRRLTGGGAVYHDLNNLCYTIIAPYNDGKTGYKGFTEPVIEYLNSLGVKAEFTGRNDVSVDGKKISGTAQTVYKDRVMFHGTLLFKTDFNILSDVLSPDKLKTESKGIKSVRKRVTNISEYLPNVSFNEFRQGITEFLKKGKTERTFSEQEIAEIEKLKQEKYLTYAWNFGNSPKGENEYNARFSFGTIKVNFDTINGVMQNVRITGDFFSEKAVSGLEEKFNGTPLIKGELEKVIELVPEYISGANAKEIKEEIFKVE